MHLCFWSCWYRWCCLVGLAGSDGLIGVAGSDGLIGVGNTGTPTPIVLFSGLSFSFGFNSMLSSGTPALRAAFLSLPPPIFLEYLFYGITSLNIFTTRYLIFNNLLDYFYQLIKDFKIKKIKMFDIYLDTKVLILNKLE